MHDHLRTVLIAPMSTRNRGAPYRIPAFHAGKNGVILLDQIRAIDKSRLVKRLGDLAPDTMAATLDALRAIFHD
jgi:mRNA interferase MazF